MSTAVSYQVFIHRVTFRVIFFREHFLLPVVLTHAARDAEGRVQHGTEPLNLDLREILLENIQFDSVFHFRWTSIQSTDRARESSRHSGRSAREDMMNGPRPRPSKIWAPAFGCLLLRLFLLLLGPGVAGQTEIQDTFCNGRGVTNSNLTCSCFSGFRGPDCSLSECVQRALPGRKHQRLRRWKQVLA